MSEALTIKEACRDLNAQYRGREWYHSVGHNGSDTITVYTKTKMGDGSVKKYYGFKVVWKHFGKSVLK